MVGWVGALATHVSCVPFSVWLPTMPCGSPNRTSTLYCEILSHVMFWFHCGLPQLVVRSPSTPPTALERLRR